VRVADQYRFQVEGGASAEDAQIWLTCDRCDYIAVIDGPISLADLIDRADEHAEVCR
jgi:hypothetical protein